MPDGQDMAEAFGGRHHLSPLSSAMNGRLLPRGNNLHHNVIFRDNGDKADQLVPYTTMKPLGSDNPRDLWKWMHACEDKTGGDAVSSRRPRSCEGTNSTRAP
jgi:hypothetical protein